MEGDTGKASQSHGSIRSLIGSCAVLLLLLAPSGAAVAWLVSGRLDAATISAALVAVGVCWIAGVLGLVSVYAGNRFAAPVQGVLGGMLVRMGLPLAVGFVLHRRGGQLADAGVLYMILGVYLVALVGETLLALRLVTPGELITKSAPPNPAASNPAASKSA